jgi:hypothetical protein
MARTRIHGQQVTDGSIELVDLSSALAATISGKADAGNLAPVATSGSYNDLSDLPSLFSGDYADLSNKPTLFSGAYADLTGKPTLFSGSYNDLSDKPTLGSLSGSLNDLSDVAVSSAAKGQFIVHDGTQFVNSRTIEADAAGTVALTVKRAASPTNYAFVVTDSSNNRLFSVGKNDSETAWQNYSNVGGFIQLGSALNSFTTLGYSTNLGCLTVLSNGNNTINFKHSDLNGWGRTEFQISRTGKYTFDFTPSPNWNSNFTTGLGVGLTSALESKFQVNTGAVGTKGIIVRGAASQTANLFEAQNSSGTVLFSIDSAGSVSAGTVPVARVSGLHAVATSGSYNDLSDKPTIPSITGLATESYVDSAVAAVVNSAPAVLDTLNELAAALGNDENFATTVAGQIGDVAGDVSALDLRVTAAEGDISDLQTDVAAKADSASLATVATSGSYNDLLNLPTLFSGSYDDLSNKPTLVSSLDDLSDVAITSPSSDQVLKYNGTAWVNATAPATFSGSYNDLSDKPTIPSSLDDLSDVAVSSAAKGEFLVHNGTSFVNSRTIEPDSTSATALTIKSPASFAGNYLHIKDSANNNVFYIDYSKMAVFHGGGNFAGGDTNCPSILVQGALPNTYTTSWTTLSMGIQTSSGVQYPRMMFTGNNGSFIDFVTTNNNAAWQSRIWATNTITIGTSNGSGSRGYSGWFNGWTDASLTLATLATSAKGLVIKATYAGQTANMFEVQNSSAASMFTVDSTGSVTISDKKVGATATTLALTTTNIYSRMLRLTGASGHAVNMIELYNNAGTLLSSFGSDGQLYDNGIAVLAYREFQTVMGVQEGSSSFFPTAVSNQIVWKDGVQQTQGTHYTVSGNYIQWTAGNVPTSSNQIDMFGTPTNWRNSAGNGNGFAYFPTVSIGERRPGISSARAGLTVVPPSSARKGIVIKGAASQSANLFEVQNSSSAVIFSIDNDGSVAAGTVPVARVSGLHAVATSGDYDDLSNKPTLFSGSYDDLTNKPSLAAVATSGDYADLSNKPTIYTPTKEVLTSLVDGTETEFVLAATPNAGAYVQVFLNGLLQSEGATEDYTISGATITFNSAPESGWKLVVYYFV